MSALVSFKIVEVPEIAKNNRKIPNFRQPQQVIEQVRAKKENGSQFIKTNGVTFTNKHAVCHCPVYNFQKMVIFHMFWGQ